VREFSLEGRTMRPVRQAVGRVERSGHSVTIRRHRELSADEMREVVERADAWRDTETERGFSMALSRLGDPADGECVLVECFDGQGTLRALLSFVPWGRDGLSLDLMRRDGTADNGLTEFMVAQLAQRARSLGVERLSLNFAMFRAAFEQGEKIGAGPVVRFWRRLLLIGSRWWQLESLYRANAKYQPTWTPRYLCFGGARDLPRIGIASALAEGFLTAPSLRRMQRDGDRVGVRSGFRHDGDHPACRSRSGCATPSTSGCSPRASSPTRSATPAPRASRRSASGSATSARISPPGSRSR